MQRSLLSLLLASPLLFSACDDAGFAEDGPVSLRACPPDCSGGDQNTSVLGSYGVSNLPLDFGDSADNLGATVELVSAEVPIADEMVPALQVKVSEYGALSMIMDLPGSPEYAGEALLDAVIHVEVHPKDPTKSVLTGTIQIVDYNLDDGLEDPEVNIHRYMLVTDIQPTLPGYTFFKDIPAWSLCKQDPETGSYDAILHPAVELDPDSGQIVSNSGQFVLGCLGGAVSKTQYRLNVYYNDTSGDRSMAAGQANAYMSAWRSWIGGVVTTQPGKVVAIHDLALGIVMWTPLQKLTWPLEAVYNSTGAACRGVAHRRYLDPAASIPGWSSLPFCTTPYSAWGSVAVRVPPSQLPPL